LAPLSKLYVITKEDEDEDNDEDEDVEMTVQRLGTEEVARRNGTIATKTTMRTMYNVEVTVQNSGIEDGEVTAWVKKAVSGRRIVYGGDDIFNKLGDNLESQAQYLFGSTVP